MLACNLPGYANRNMTTTPATVATQPPAPAVSSMPELLSATPPPPTITPVPTVTYTPVFEPGPCLFFPPQGFESSLECGMLAVPESRLNPTTETIRLHVAIFRSRSANPAPEPLIHLAGGPGSSATDLIWYHFARGEGRFLDDRDYIFFDQRGTGHSEPSLACPEREDISGRLLEENLSIEQQNQLEIETMLACRDRLTAQGVDLMVYHSAASAADINDLRLALGYQQINLYGVSYGTRLALTVMRDYPEILRSVILDSTYPPEENLYTSWSANGERAFDSFFSACESDPECSNAYPGLETVFYQSVDTLNASPARVPASDPATGREYTALLTGDLLVDVVFGALYRPDVMAKLPQMIADIQRGYYNPFLQDRLSRYLDRTTSRGMQVSVQCAEEIPFSTVEELQAQAAAVEPHIAHNYVAELAMLYQLCPLWGAGEADPIENTPVITSIPTLIFAGTFDPITPPAWGQSTANRLENSHYFEFPVGHWATRAHDCPLRMAADFLNNPSIAPDASCIPAIPLPDFVP
jgi:pimeloyl-ACP methyl ester carboxylesterase